MDKLKEIKKNAKEIALVASAVIVAGIVLLTTRLTNHKDAKLLSQEIARSMTYNQVQPGENIAKDTNGNSVANVKFDAFFLRDLNGDGYAEGLRGTCREIGEQDTLYMELNVTGGELRNAKIQIQGHNFYLATALPKDQQLKSNYIGTNIQTIEFNTIGNGTQRMLTGKVASGDYTSPDKYGAIGNNTNNYSRTDNKIILTGTYVNGSGTETQIVKEVPLTVDWHGTTTAKISRTNISKSVTDFSSLYDETNLNLSFTAETAETNNKLILKDNVLTGTIPALNGYMPTAVTITGTNVTYTYNQATGEFSARTDAVVNAGSVTSNAYTSQSGNTRYNSYTFNISYPKQAYEETGNQSVTLKIPMYTYYEGYNNPNEEFDNPYVSNSASSTVVATWYQYSSSTEASVQIGKYLGNPYNKYYISKEKPLKIYNDISEDETNDYYTVRWYAYTGSTEYSKLFIKEDVKNSSNKIDTFIKTDLTEVSTEDVVSTIGIYFSNPASLVGDDGWIKVYNDDTNRLLETFTKDNWNNYSESNPYMYENPVKRVRVETSKANKGSSITIYHVKEINDSALTEKYDREVFDTLEHIKTNMNVYFGESNSPYSRTATADYVAPFSTATIALSQPQISTQEANANEVITITTKSSNFMEQKWKNGTFILKMPSTIMDMSVNSVTATASEGSVTVKDKILYQENGNYYLRIELENGTPATYTITANCNLTANPRMVTSTETIEMYAKNADGVDYFSKAQDIYDVDTNGNIEENVHKSTASLVLIAPNTLITHQVAKNYDSKNSETIAPQVAKVEKRQRGATIEITLTNNYSNVIKNILVQGEVPFTGNKSVIGNVDLGSNFNTTMSNTGITVPAELASYATVYYSTKQRPTNIISNTENGWVTAENVTDWSQIKTFIIDLGEYELGIEANHTFSYQINIPSGLNYNDVSYSQHAVYFDLVTDAGLYSTSTEVSKLGFMIVRQYDLVLTKYQKDTSKKLQGATFKITEVGNESSTVKKSTNVNGTLTIPGLYAEKTYKLKETSISDDYVLNSEEIEFYTYVDGNDNLVVKYNNNGSYQDLTAKYSWVKSATATKQAEDDYKVQIDLENEVKARLRIVKTNGNNEPLKGAKFSLTGQGKNMVVTTNSDGIASTSGIYLEQTYTLTETKAKGYYLKSAITFSVTKSGSGFTYTLNGDATAQVTTTDEIPTINLNIDDEEIPKYSLKVTTYAEHKDGQADVPLKGAQYKLTGDGLDSSGIMLTSNENGEISVDGLYEYVEVNGSAKGGYTGQYTLTQIYAPEGYTINSTPIVFKAYRNAGSLTTQVISGSDQISGIKPITVTNAATSSPTVEFGIENEPIFTLKKYDEEGNPLAGAKFSIYTVNDNLETVDFAKDVNGDYVGARVGEKPIELTFTSNNATYPWTKMEDGVWKSTNYNVSSSTVTMTSNEFTLTEARSITFEWTVSSESVSFDYVYYTITNKTTGATIGGNATDSKIGGTSYGTVYNSLTWNTVTKDLDPGTYTISFTYRKDSSVNSGLDTAYVRNIDVGTNGIYGVTTPESGEIQLNLPQGYYKAVEVETPEKYALAENEADRTQYFGIDQSKAAEVESGLVWKTAIKGEGFNTINSSYGTADGGVVVVGSVYGTTDYISSIGRKDGLVIKYDVNGNIEWIRNIGGTLGEEFKKVIQTQDGGYAVVGYFESTDMNIGSGITNSGARDAILIKLNSSGEYVWSAVIGGELEDYAYSLCEDSNNGNIIVTGGYFSDTLGFSGTTQTLTNLGDMDGYVAAFSSTGAFQWAQNLGSTNTESGVQAVDVAVVNGQYAVAVNYWDTLFVDTAQTASIANAGQQDSAIVFYNTSGTYQKYIRVSGAGNDDIRGIAIDNDGNMVVYGNRTNSTTTLSSTSGEVTIDAVGGTTYLSCYVYRLDPDGYYLADQSFTFGNNAGNDEIMEVVPTEDDGLLIAGFTYDKELDIDGDGTNDIISTGDTKTSYSRGYAAKLNENNKVTSAYRQYLQGNHQETRTVAELADGGFVAGGVANGTKLIFDPNAEEITGLDAYLQDGFIVKYGTREIAPGIPQKTELEFSNTLQKFTVTTTIYSVENGEEEVNRLYDTGGAVTGSYSTAYPEGNHKKLVETIKYNQNGEQAITITPNTNYSIVGITINGIEYEYSASETDGSVIIPAFENVTEDKNIIVKVNKNMTEVKVNHYLWTNANGVTTTKVADSKSLFGKIGDAYQTSPKQDINYSIITNEDYYSGKTESAVKTELGISAWSELGYDNYNTFKADLYIPRNASGTYAAGGATVNFYYKEIKYTVTVKHLIVGTENAVPNKNTGNAIEDEITGDLALGASYSANPSANVDYNTYEIVSVSNTDENAVENEETRQVSGTISANITITYYYQFKEGGAITVHHYIAGTTTQVPSNSGGTVADETITTVIENGTPRTARIGDSYTTTSASNVAPNYGLATDLRPANASGTFTSATQEVTYFYRMVTPILSNTVTTTVNKQTINEMDEDQSLIYTITYRATVSRYKGNVTTTITDTLPFEIDLSKPYSLNGGTYDAQTKTITWNNVNPVDTYANASSGTINIIKTISLTYKNLLPTTNNIVNTIEANVHAIDSNTTSQTTSQSATTKYTHFRSLTSTIVWSDENNSKGVRPDTVKMNLIGTVTKEDLSVQNIDLEALGSNIETSAILRDSTGSENGENWTYTWTQLPKYDSEGREIMYTLEAATLNYELYTPEISGNMNDGYTLTVYYTYGGSTESQTETQYFDAETGTTNVNFEAQENGFTRRDYTFENWKLETPEGTNYNEHQTVTVNPRVNSDKTTYNMYAIWEKQ